MVENVPRLGQKMIDEQVTCSLRDHRLPPQVAYAIHLAHDYLRR